jgi:hypothetical protein
MQISPHCCRPTSHEIGGLGRAVTFMEHEECSGPLTGRKLVDRAHDPLHVVRLIDRERQRYFPSGLLHYDALTHPSSVARSHLVQHGPHQIVLRIVQGSQPTAARQRAVRYGRDDITRICVSNQCRRIPHEIPPNRLIDIRVTHWRIHAPGHRSVARWNSKTTAGGRCRYVQHMDGG